MSARGLGVGVCLGVLLFLLSCSACADPITARIGLTDSGLQANGGCWWPSLSADGRFVAFHSWADNLTAGDTNWVYDVYVRDRLFGLNHLVSISSDGILGDGESIYPMISTDGKSIAFCSDAGNLASVDSGGVKQIFVRDWDIGVTEMVSVSTSGERANAPCDRPAVSGDGRYVVFQSTADNLVPGAGGILSIFLRDRVAHTTACVSVSSAGEPANFLSMEPTLTPDGRYVVFSSWGDNLVPGDTNNQRDVFLRDTQTGLTERVSLAHDGAQGDERSGGGRPAITPDGRFIAFAAIAGNLVPDDTNEVCDVFVRDRLLETTERVSVSSSGEQGDEESGEDAFIVSISADGRYVAFSSLADNLVPDDTNETWDAFLHDRQTGTTTRASVSTSGTEGNADSGFYGLAIESQGAFVVFDSHANNLIADDTNPYLDIYLHGDATPTGPPAAIINGDALYTNSTEATLSLYSGGYPELRYANEGGSWTNWEAASETRAWTLPAGDGPKRVYLQGRDIFFNESEVYSDEIVLDTTPPETPTISINDDAVETANRAVTLTLASAGAAEMRLRNESETWSRWIAFASTRAHTLSAGAGLKHVSVETRDQAGNVSAETWDEILLNPTPPSGIGIHINDDDEVTSNPAVTLQLTTLDSVEMRFRDEGEAWTEWESFASSRAWILPGEDGLKRVYAQGRTAGLVESPETWDEILLDTTPPGEVSLSINDGAAFTNTIAVTLTITAVDAAEMRFRNEGESWSDWEPVARHKAWTLPTGDGVKEVSLQVRDEAGNLSAEVEDEVTLDTVPPSGLAISINGGEASTLSHHVTLSLSASGAAQMRFCNESDPWSDWRSFSATTGWTLSSSRGEKTVSFQARDAAGNVSAATTDTIDLVNFADVPGGHWAYAQIMSCVDAAIVAGYWDGYHPDEVVNRAQMAVFISRALASGDSGVPPGPALASFSDVPTDHWAFKYIEYAKDQQIVSGYWDGYHPDEVVNRAQMAVFVARSICDPTGDEGLADYTPPATPSFADVPDGHWAYTYVEYCRDEGIVSGYWDGYHPDESVTRAQMAVYIARAFQLP